MGRAEKLLIALVIALVVFVAQAIVRQPRGSAAPAAAPQAPAIDTPVAVAPPVVKRPPPVSAAPKNDLNNSSRSSQEPPPLRDLADIKSRLLAGESGTYIGDMLASQDSVIYRWPERRVKGIRVWVASARVSVGWYDDFADMARGVFSEWGAADSPLRFEFVVDSSGSDIKVRWVSSYGTTQIGNTTRLTDQSSWIVGATIDIAVRDGAGRTLTPTELAGVVRHEVGHALGLGHSRDRRTLMFPEETMYDISPMDLATLRLIYTLPPGPTNR